MYGIRQVEPTAFSAYCSALTGIRSRLDRQFKLVKLCDVSGQISFKLPLSQGPEMFRHLPAIAPIELQIIPS